MKRDLHEISPEERLLHGRTIVCVVCGNRSRGAWHKVNGQWVRAPYRHKTTKGGDDYCVGSYRAGNVADEITA